VSPHVADFTEEQQASILVALTDAFQNIPHLERMSEAEVEGTIYTRIRSQLPSIFGPASQSFPSKRHKTKKRHLKERLGETKWRTFMQLYRAVRDEHEERDVDPPEVIIARMQASIKRSGGIIDEMVTLNKQAEDVGGKLTTLQWEIENAE
jgi:hypothetical protein